MALPKILQELDGKLSTSGGTVNGSITVDGGNYRGLVRGSGVTDFEFIGANNDGCFSFAPGESGAFSDKKSASLFLTSTDYTGQTISAGSFVLSAMNATTGAKSLAGSPDGSLTWGGKPVLFGESGGFPVGFIALYSGNNVPNGWFRCDGSTIANMDTNYPKLYAVLGTNVLPNYSGKVPLGAPSDINTAVRAGLPNITGRVFSDDPNYYWGAGTWAEGAFANHRNGGSYIGADPVSVEPRGNGFTFDASRSSAIYGNSTTVTPPSVKVAVLIRHD